MRVAKSVGRIGAAERGEGDAGGRDRARALGGERRGARGDRGAECLWLHERVDEAPLERALAAHAFDRRAEDIGAIAPHAALVGEARQPAGPGQHAE